MNYHLYSYRFALEILQHRNYQLAWKEIEGLIHELPLFIYPGKSKNEKLDVVQQALNTYCDRSFSVENQWDYHPLATEIEDSKLAADFAKSYEDVTIQAEVQFGNMARWYSDIFKFQTAYSQGKINLGLCIVPMFNLAKRIDENVANFERASRELPSAKLSITLPILLIGVYPDEKTPVVNLKQCDFEKGKDITANTNKARENRFRIVNGYLENIPMREINSHSPTGPMP
jgi:hypothetical protein